VALSLLKRLVKIDSFKFEELKYILNEDLISLWQKNLAVMNKDTKAVAGKVEKHIIKLIKT
jgi:hypothetical protein